MIVLSVNAKQNVFSARANIISMMMIAFFQFIHKIRKQRAHYYYSRLISTPALVSPSSPSLLMIPMLMPMMLLLLR